METIVLGDTHGRHDWKDAVFKHIGNLERVIFVGDYFDSFDIPFERQLSNFRDILWLRENHPHIDVVLLIGNHDFQYLDTHDYCNYSGFQRRYASAIRNELMSHLDKMQIAYSYKDILFTHAGVSHGFLNKIGIANSENAGKIADALNKKFKKNPNLFCIAPTSMYGDSLEDGCIWIRPQWLANDNAKCTQVVGHTRMKMIIEPANTNIWFIDVLEEDAGQFLVIDSDGNISIDTIHPNVKFLIGGL